MNRTTTIYDRARPDLGRATITAEIRQTDKGPELSMTGTAAGHAGQCDDTIRARFGHLPAVAGLLDLWARHHLNGLRPGCSHQSPDDYGTGRTKALIVKEATPPQLAALTRERDEKHAGRIAAALSEYLLTTTPGRIALDAAAVDKRPATADDTKAAAALARRTPSQLADIAAGKAKTPETYPSRVMRPGTTRPIPRTQALAQAILEHIHTTNPPPPLADALFPDSIGYPCPTCGYRYGHAWNYEPLPADIEQTINALMDANDATHADDTEPTPGPRTLAERVTQYGLTLDLEMVSTRPDRDPSDEWSATARHWRYTITRAGSTAPALTGHYSQGSAITETPTAADILGALILDATGLLDTPPQSFEDWAPEYGFDPDSRKAERMYHACRQTADALRQMFSPAELESLADYIDPGDVLLLEWAGVPEGKAR